MLTLEESTHVYRWNGKVVPSVSQIIAPLYEGAFDGIKAEVLERKRTLGTALHYATELLDRDQLDEDSIDTAIRPYLDAYVRAKAERNMQWTVIEEPRYHHTLRYAGTIDRYGTVDGEPAVVDFKTVATLHAAVGVQLAGYESLMQTGRPMKRYALQLLPTGEYRLVEYKSPDDRAAFMACLALFNWKQKVAA